jgi:hypothetical protein
MLAKIAQNLQEHENAIRIKKLIFCACQQQWENNIEILNQYSTQALIRDLITTHSTLSQLSHTLYQVVETLNRKAVYYPLADVVVDQLTLFYIETATNPFESSQATTLAIAPLGFEQILQELTTHENSLQIKQLIYCACEKKWANDLAHLEQLSLKELVGQLLQLNPTKEQLSHTLYQVVKSLNRQGEYFLVANLILEKLVKLYVVPDAVTQVIASSQSATQQQQENCSNAMELQAPASLPTQAVEYNPLQLRLEVIKYTNPLRAKILIFSILKHPFNFSDRDWSLLKTDTLDSLLFQLYQHCCNLTELENLLRTAQTLPHPDENTQAAGAIFQSLKQLYVDG